MPFQAAMDDTFHYGIQNAVRSAGYICERSDQSSFVGDVLERIRQRISTSALVVADLTGANPSIIRMPRGRTRSDRERRFVK